MGFWQMTLQELTEDNYRPTARENPANGVTDWFCPICGMVVGIHSNGTVHDAGWLFQRDVCRNGHAVDWNI